MKPLHLLALGLYWPSAVVMGALSVFIRGLGYGGGPRTVFRAMRTAKDHVFAIALIDLFGAVVVAAVLAISLLSIGSQPSSETLAVVVLAVFLGCVTPFLAGPAVPLVAIGSIVRAIASVPGLRAEGLKRAIAVERSSESRRSARDYQVSQVLNFVAIENLPSLKQEPDRVYKTLREFFRKFPEQREAFGEDVQLYFAGRKLAPPAGLADMLGSGVDPSAFDSDESVEEERNLAGDGGISDFDSSVGLHECCKLIKELRLAGEWDLLRRWLKHANEIEEASIEPSGRGAGPRFE